MIILALAAAAVAAAAATAIFARRTRRAAMAPGRCELISAELFGFLEEADDAYILAHETTQIGRFGKYATETVCHGLMESIYKNPSRMFGTRKYRRRSWNVVAHDPEWIVVCKRLSHVPVNLGKGIHTALGDDSVEIWTIARLENGYRIIDVNVSQTPG
ncbi:hypothetical protein [Cohnella cellulosilytica]|uniref:Uncharacterized protein n=1 Tax=Cohnella cellulosilytica TaxID=986710 RepID=A0ABW2F5E8_9BACL